MVQVIDTVWICRDCLDAVEFSDPELGYVPDTLFRQMRKMKNYRPDLDLGKNVLVADRYGDDAGTKTYVTSRCEVCGSFLAGERYRYSVIG